MHRVTRFLIGVLLGGGALVVYFASVGLDSVLARATGIAPWAALAVVGLVVCEGLADGIGVWASVNPLGRGLSGGESVQFALAGDFFDTLSPAGPVSSEPIMARFIGVATGTTYSDALAVRTVAKYAKSGTQLLLSTVVVLAVLVVGSSPRYVVVTLVAAALGLAALGVAVLRFRRVVSRAVVFLVTPLVYWLSSLYREEPYGRVVVESAVERFWSRILGFRGRPKLLALVAVGGVLEQVLTATALWVALAGTGSAVAFLPIVAVVPLPQVSSVAPIPASLGAYDVLLGGIIVAMTTASPAAAAAAVLIVRTASIPFGLSAGGLCAAFLRGWRPGA